MLEHWVTGFFAATTSTLVRDGRRVESRVEEVLRTLALLGQAEKVEDAFFLSE